MGSGEGVYPSMKWAGGCIPACNGAGNGDVVRHPPCTWDTFNKQVVRILLESFLVDYYFWSVFAPIIS